MSAPRPVPRTPDPATHTALAELLQLGMTVARAAAGLAEIEGRAVDALAEAAAEVARAAATPAASLAHAIEAGRQADATDAARDAIAARLALITDSFEKAARAVRRTAALQARLANPRQFADPPPHDTRRAAVSPRRPANDREPAERPDRPETGDELGARTDGQVLQAIARDLSGLAPGPATLPTPPAKACTTPLGQDHPPRPVPDT